jgi:aminoglycoside 6'-N-acetyltransferase I
MDSMPDVNIRPIQRADLDRVAHLCAALWPDGPPEEHRLEMTAILEGRAAGPYPSLVLVADAGPDVVGFLEVGMRSHADGCDSARPVGFLEGWYVEAEWRGQGIGRRLVEAAEEWARQQGCIEMGSDTWLDDLGSQKAHAALGYEEVDRCVNYRKLL